MNNLNLLSESINVILENQSDSGSFIACPNFRTYNFCWIRDGSFIANSMDVVGKYDSAEKFFSWVDRVITTCEPKIENLKNSLNEGKKIDKNCVFNARFTLDGKEEKGSKWGNFQLDAYGTWLWALAEHIEYTGNTELLNKFRKSIDLTIQYIDNLWYYPNFDIWEENSDKIHTSTLACLYGGLNAIEKLISSGEIRTLKNRIRSYILTNCVKNSKFVKYVGSEDVDASLLWLGVPFKVVDLNDQIYKNTVHSIEQELLCGGGVHRYKKDTYYGGGEWILLSCFLGWYYVLTGNIEKAKSILNWVEGTADKNGHLPEQDCSHMLDPNYYDHWVKLWGKPASPLLWSHAMYIILLKEIEKAEQAQLS